MEYLSSLFCQATRLAAQAHDGAYYAGSRMPYLLHALETAQIVSSMTEDEDVLAAAVLHEAPESTLNGEGEMRETVGSHVTELVLAAAAAGGADPEDRDRACQQAQVEALLAERRLEVKMIVLGDKLSEVRLLQRSWQRLGEQVWGRCRCGREALGWYYQAMTDALQDLNAYPVWHELANAVWELFWQERDSEQLRFDMTAREMRELALF